MTEEQILITKANGEREPFNRAKLDHSLKRAGASRQMRTTVIEEIERSLKDGMTTQEIYKHAFDILRQERQKPFAARYSIKRAILDLGPSGFPFERFMGEIFRTLGYTNIYNNTILKGDCVEHELDITALHNGSRMGAEVKFHNNHGLKTDLKVALYVRERFDDLKNHIDEGWLITNTRFTRNAIKYGKCSGLRMLGWDYPRGRGLEVLINEASVHPITALTSISKATQRALLDDGIVLCRQLLTHLDDLKKYGVDTSDAEMVKNEVTGLCAGVPSDT